MIVGFFVVVALMCVVVIDASAAYLRRQQLGSLADGAALAAADGAQGSRCTRAGSESTPRWMPAARRSMSSDTSARSERPNGTPVWWPPCTPTGPASP
jgi:hypothetical protein